MPVAVIMAVGVAGAATPELRHPCRSPCPKTRKRHEGENCPSGARMLASVPTRLRSCRLLALRLALLLPLALPMPPMLLPPPLSSLPLRCCAPHASALHRLRSLAFLVCALRSRLRWLASWM